MTTKDVLIISEALNLSSRVEVDTLSTVIDNTFLKFYNQVEPIHRLPDM